MVYAKDQRDQARVPKQLPVLFGTSDNSKEGVLTNLSVSGLALVSTHAYQSDTEISVLLKVDDEEIPLKGIVRWYKRTGRKIGLKPTYEMGVEFTERTDEYKELLESLVDDFREHREEPRFNQAFKVTFEKPEELLAQYSQNISRGGVYIVSDDPPERKSTVDINIYILDTMDQIHVEGKVMHVIRPGEANFLTEEPGFGVQFTKFHGDGKEKLLEYLQKLKQKIAMRKSA